jgi:hypothetical protein
MLRVGANIPYSDADSCQDMQDTLQQGMNEQQ